jgi:tetratricopeptide (TPR) repeat protein
MARAQNDPAQIVRFLTAIVHLQRDLPDRHSQVIAHLDECLALLRDVDDPSSLAFILQQYGMVEAAAKEYSSAQDYFRRMLEIHRSTGNKLGLAWGLSLLAEAAWFQGDLSGAQDQYEHAHALFVEQDNVDGAMIVLHHLGQIARQQGRFGDAVTFYCSSLSSAATLNNRHMMARCLAGLGGTELERTHIEHAALLISAAHRLFDSLPPFLAPYDLDELERQTARVRADNQSPAVSAAWEMGQTTSTKQVVFATLMKMGGT